MTHDAATHPPKYSMYVDASRPLAGTGTGTVACAGTVTDLGFPGFFAEIEVTRAVTGTSPGFARNSVAFHCFGPPPWGQNHAPDDEVPGTAGPGVRTPTPRCNANPPPTTTTRTATANSPCPRPRVVEPTCRSDLIVSPASG